MPTLSAVIPKTDLIVGRWYVGRGRNGNVGLWNGEDFLLPAKSFPHRTLKHEPYYTAEEGTFQPFREIDEGLMARPFGNAAWSAHYGALMEFADSDDRTSVSKDGSATVEYVRLYDQAAALVREHSVGSAALLQRHLRLPYAAALAMLEGMELRGVVGEPGENQLRQVLGADGQPLPIPAAFLPDASKHGDPAS